MSYMRNRHIEEFIKLYESQPCLWRVKSKEYYKKHLREAAYKKLVEKLREIEPDSDKNDVVKKINSLRSSVRKEVRKRKLSIKSGATADDIYKPKLWYFDLFNFLEENNSSNVDNNSDDEIELTEDWDEYSLQETQSKESSAMPPNPVSRTQSECETPQSSYRPTAKRLRTDVPASEAYLVSDNVQKDSSSQSWNEDSLQETPIEESFSMHPSPVSRTQSECEAPLSSYRPTAKRVRTDVPTSKVVYVVCDHAQKNCTSQVEDRYDLLGKSIACRIRALDKRQRQIVEKNINDILYEAEMEVLDAPILRANLLQTWRN